MKSLIFSLGLVVGVFTTLALLNFLPASSEPSAFTSKIVEGIEKDALGDVFEWHENDDFSVIFMVPEHGSKVDMWISAKTNSNGHPVINFNQNDENIVVRGADGKQIVMKVDSDKGIISTLGLYLSDPQNVAYFDRGLQGHFKEKFILNDEEPAKLYSNDPIWRSVSIEDTDKAQ